MPRRGSVLLHQQMERGAVDRTLLLRQEDRAGKGFRVSSARLGGRASESYAAFLIGDFLSIE